MRPLRTTASLCSVALTLLAACSGEPASAPAQKAATPTAAEPARPAPRPEPTAPAPAPATPEQEAARASNAFGFALYALARSTTDNLIISPPSLELAFAMVHQGARGETATELARLLRVGKLADPQAALAALRGALGRLDGRDGLELTIASRVWGQQGYPFAPDYVAALRDWHAAPLGEVDFRAAPAEACKAINAWSEAATRKRIQGTCVPEALPPDVRLVLANAVSFRGRWARPFDPAATRPGDFRVSAETTVQAPMMQRRGAFRMATAPGLRLLELPYRGGLHMIVLLPDVVDGVRTVEEQMATSFERWLAELAEVPSVQVALPRFQARGTLSLPGLLGSMGVRTLFDAGAADLGGVGAEKPLFVSAAIHQGFIQVDEEGTEAAAVTTIAPAGAAPPQAVTFTVDRPFVYAIHDPATGAVLFLGRVVDPTR